MFIILDWCIITCADNGSLSLTVGSGGAANPTAAPTTVVPTQLPRTGFFDEIQKWSVPGTVLVLIGVAMRFLL